MHTASSIPVQLASATLPIVRAQQCWLAVAVMGLMSAITWLVTDISHLPPSWDEPIMHPVLQAMVRAPAVATWIDYEDTKGPAFFWIYALWGMGISDSIVSLRLCSSVLWIFSAWPLAWLFQHGGVRGWSLVLATILYAMLPYWHALGHLMMSEPGFVFGQMWMCYAFVHALKSQTRASMMRHVVVWAALLVVLLHYRPHALAVALAMVLIAGVRQGFNAWPWAVACGVAVLLRVPLYLRWGGLVSPHYQDRYYITTEPYMLAYFGIAALPLIGALGLAGFWRMPRRYQLGVLVAAAALATSTLALRDDIQPGGRSPELAGPVINALSRIPSGLPRAGVTMVLSFAAVICLGGLIALSLRQPIGALPGVMDRLTLWPVPIAWLLHSQSDTFFDRYLLVYGLLLPMLWVSVLPRWLLVLQGLALAGMVVDLTKWLYTA